MPHARSIANLPRAALAACLALGVSAGCKAPVVRTQRDVAQQATREQDWKLAARLWRAQFQAGGPLAAEACLEGARAERELGRPDEARELLDRGLESFALDAALWEERGNVLDELGFRRAAEHSYTRALELEPERLSALLERAEIRLQLGLASAARKDLEACLQRGLDGSRVWVAYARSLVALGEARSAFDAYARGFEQGPVESASLIGAAALYLGGALNPARPRDRERVAAWLNIVAAREPQNALAHHWLGLLAKESGAVPEAEACFERALAADPTHLPTLEHLARIAFERGDRERADTLARRALELERDPARRKIFSGWLASPSGG
ncbi:MAG TPA: tetratricopeptide repeat protein [Planctomycetota bacterium]|nr:tetratricopeptide repeat protein [Planctomycetota bacterium]